MPPPLINPVNWQIGWGLILAGLLAGVVLGMGFHRDAFLGGYGSFRRRMVRLGHIALVALGALNVLLALAPWPMPGHWTAAGASLLLAAGGVLMPAVCFLAAWRMPLRHLFPIPVLALVAGVVLVLLGGWT